MADDFTTVRIPQLAEVADLEMTDLLLIQRGDGPAQTAPVQAVLDAIETGIDEATEVALTDIAGATAIQTANVAQVFTAKDYPTNAKALSNGVASVAIGAAGTGGTPGTYAWTTTGDGGTNASGYLVVGSGGTITEVVVRESGYDYTSAPTIVIAGSHGVTGHTLTPSLAINRPVGTFWRTRVTDGFELFENVAGTATARGIYADKALIDAMSAAAVVEYDQPNLMTAEQLSFDTLPVAVAGTRVKAMVNGLPCVVHTANPSTGALRGYWRFPRSAFPSGKISASAFIEAMGAGSDGSFKIIQRNGAFGQVLATTIASGLTAAVTTPTPVRSVTPPDLQGTTEWVDFDYDLPDASAKVRTVTLRAPLVADGSASGFRRPRYIPPVDVDDVPILNRYPNIAMDGVGAVSARGTRIIEDGEYVLSMTGAGDQIHSYDAAAVGALAPGAVVTFTAEAYAGSGVDRVDISVQSLNAAGAVLSTTQDGNAASGAYETLTAAHTVHASAATLRFRFIKRSTTTEGKFKQPLVLSNSALAQLTEAGPRPSVSEKTIFLDPVGGDDAADGLTRATPVATVATAAAKCKPTGQIIVLDGDFTDGITQTIAGFSRLHLGAEPGARPRFILGNKLTGVTKTPGYNNIYQATITPPLSGRWLWEHDLPDHRTFITLADRHPRQEGATHRLPSTRMDEATAGANLAATLTTMDASAAPTWYGSGGVTYFRPVGGRVATVSVSAGGTGYTDGETVYLNAADESVGGAMGTVAVTAGVVTGVTVTEPASGYAVSQAITIVPVTGAGAGATGTIATVAEGVGTEGEFYVPSATKTLFGYGTKREDISAAGITVLYGIYGLDANNCLRWRAVNCTAGGAAYNGMISDDTPDATEIWCRGWGCGNDGGGVHRYVDNPNQAQFHISVQMMWSHDNRDDGWSPHEDWVGSLTGGLFEYNRDRGVAISFGAHFVLSGGVTRYNGHGAPPTEASGEGVAVVAPPNYADDKGVGTQVEVIDWLSYGNNVNYGVDAAVADKMILRNSVSRDPVIHHYYTSGGTIEIDGCEHDGMGSGTVKAGVGNYVVRSRTPTT